MFEWRDVLGLLSGFYAADPDRNEADCETKRGSWQDFGTRGGALNGEKKIVEGTDGSLYLQKMRPNYANVWWFLSNSELLASENKMRYENMDNMKPNHKKRQPLSEGVVQKF